MRLVQTPSRWTKSPRGLSIKAFTFQHLVMLLKSVEMLSQTACELKSVPMKRVGDIGQNTRCVRGLKDVSSIYGRTLTLRLGPSWKNHLASDENQSQTIVSKLSRTWITSTIKILMRQRSRWFSTSPTTLLRWKPPLLIHQPTTRHSKGNARVRSLSRLSALRENIVTLVCRIAVRPS